MTIFFHKMRTVVTWLQWVSNILVSRKMGGNKKTRYFDYNYITSICVEDVSLLPSNSDRTSKAWSFQSKVGVTTTLAKQTLPWTCNRQSLVKKLIRKKKLMRRKPYLAQEYSQVYNHYLRSSRLSLFEAVPKHNIHPCNSTRWIKVSKWYLTVNTYNIAHTPSPCLRPCLDKQIK